MNPYQKQFNVRQNTSAYWHSKSHDLLVSARTLWQAMQENSNLEVNCWATYMMLMGMSFELMFKAHCVGAGISFDPTHNLVTLARTANVTTSKLESGILRVLSEHVIWDGRYPTPKSFKHLEDHWKHQSEALYETKEAGSSNTVVRNDNFDFENLLATWRPLSDSYMERYN